MLTKVEIDEDLLRSAMRFGGEESPRETVERGLRALTEERRRAQLEAIEGLRGLGWDGDLDEMRRDRPRQPIE